MNPEQPTSADLILRYLLDAEVQASMPLTPTRVMLSLTVTFLLALLILAVYRFCHRQVVNRESSSLAMVLVALVTTLVIMPISTSIVLSLGMVGALSIVRFRTAMKDPADIAFLFWGIAIGVCNGAGFFNVSILGTGTIAVLVIIMSRVPLQSGDPMLLVVRYSPTAEERVVSALPKGRLLSKIGRSDETELTFELKAAKDTVDLTDRLLRVDGVVTASVVRYDGSFLAP
jgi:uncharacterized membrane protein YhiD involved in acid resistance